MTIDEINEMYENGELYSERTDPETGVVYDECLNSNSKVYKTLMEMVKDYAINNYEEVMEDVKSRSCNGVYNWQLAMAFSGDHNDDFVSYCLKRLQPNLYTDEQCLDNTAFLNADCQWDCEEEYRARCKRENWEGDNHHPDANLIAMLLSDHILNTDEFIEFFKSLELSSSTTLK